MIDPTPRVSWGSAWPPSGGHRAWRMTVAVGRSLGWALRCVLAAGVLLALVAGTPWALWHYIGWPLPTHVPTVAEVRVVLGAPMSATIVLDVLGCVCWIIWAAFTISVLGAMIDLVRGGADVLRSWSYSAADPVRALAAGLVGAILLALLGHRPAAAPAPGGSSGAVATDTPTAAAVPGAAGPHAGEGIVRAAAFAAPITTAGGTRAGSVVVVEAPRHGVHDSLWRIAHRTLGEGARWPEIFRANQGRPLPGGATFTQPSLIYPGQILALPTAASPPTAPPVTTPPAPERRSPEPAPSSATTTPPPSAGARPASPVPLTHPAPETGTGSHPSTRDPVVRGGPDLFVGLGLAAAVSAALLVARRRYNARYRPGSGDRDDFPVAPVVYQLRQAHLRAHRDDEVDRDEDNVDGDAAERVASPCVGAAAWVIGTPDAGSGVPTVAPRLGVGAGREIALNLAVARGLGLAGPGSPAAVRALLVTALSTTQGDRASTADTRIVVPAADLAPLLGHAAAHTRLPAALCVVESLEAALDALEAETLVRAGTPPRNESRCWPGMVLAATVPEHDRARLQAVLDNGAPCGITGLLLGQWRPGVSVYVRADGTVSATNPGVGEALRGCQLFRLADADTAALLELLHQADPEPPAPDDTPRVPRPRPALPPRTPQPDPAPATVDPSCGSDVGGVRPIRDNTLEITATAGPPAPDPGRGSTPALRGPGAGPAPCATAPVTTGEIDQAASEGTPAPAAARASGTGGASAAVPVRIDVLGAPRVQWRPDADPAGAREITGAFQPRTRELLVFLALHPDGASREALTAALWPDTPPERATNALNTALSRLRRAVSTATGGALADIVLVGESRYQLDPAVVVSDFWSFAAALAARRAAATDQHRVHAHRAIIDSYGGPLADGMSTEWIETAREAIRRDALDAVAALARALVAHDPQQTLDLLEAARALDPHNEALYRDIMRLQERLGHLDAIPRTLALLTTRLAEVDTRPTDAAIALATRARHRGNDPPTPAPPPGVGERDRRVAG